MMGPDPIKKRPASSKQLLAKPRGRDGQQIVTERKRQKLITISRLPATKEFQVNLSFYCAVAISWAGCNYSIYFRLYTTKIRALLLLH